MRRTWVRGSLMALGLALVVACSSDEVTRPAGASCLRASDCNAPLVCAFQRCSSQCSADRDCDNGTCVLSGAKAGVCLSNAVANCTRNSDCASPLVCGRRSKCEVQCQDDRDCLVSQTCAQGSCVDREVPVPDVAVLPAQLGDTCRYNHECSAAFVCLRGKCDYECLVDRDCRVTFGDRCVDKVCRPGGADAGADATGIDASDASDASGDDGFEIVDARADGSDAPATTRLSPLRGATGGDTFEDRCPGGQLMIGVEGAAASEPLYKGVLTQFRTLCGKMTLSITPTQTLISIVPSDVVPARTLPARGLSTGAVTTASCAANHVVVGFNGRTTNHPNGQLMAYFNILCAPLIYQNGTLSKGVPNAQGGVGNPWASDLVPDTVCPANTFAQGMMPNSKEVTNGVRMMCEPLGFP